VIRYTCKNNQLSEDMGLRRGGGRSAEKGDEGGEERIGGGVTYQACRNCGEGGDHPLSGQIDSIPVVQVSHYSLASLLASYSWLTT
jgi:hypothetical protein